MKPNSQPLGTFQTLGTHPALQCHSSRPVQFAWGLSLVMILSLQACGGGGGGGGGSTAVNIDDSVRSIALNPTPGTAGQADPVAQMHLTDLGLTGNALTDTSLMGNGTVVAMVDGAIDIGHEDLVGRFVPGRSYSYRNNNTDPSPPQGTAGSGSSSAGGGPNDYHGTATSGLVGASALNGKDVRGVAPLARLVGFDPISLSVITDFAISDAINRAYASTADVINNSWGPSDNVRSYQSPPGSFSAAIDNAFRNGRGGKGTAIVFAAGNGGSSGDRSDYDGYANDPRVIAVGAVDTNKSAQTFSEPGANVLISGYSGVPSTDITGARGGSSGNTISSFSGTSAAAPIVSGVIAQMYGVNPGLSIRDVRYILAKSAVAPSGQTINPNRLAANFREKTGYGVVHSINATNLARGFTSLGPELTCSVSPSSPSNGANIPAGLTGLLGQALTGTASFTDCPITKIESMELTLALNSDYTGRLNISLTPPTSIGLPAVNLATAHTCGSGGCTNLTGGFRHSIVAYMDENPNGNWTLSITDGGGTLGNAVTSLLTGTAGNFISWTLTIRGRAV